MLNPGTEPPSTTQLERWRQGGYLPPTERHGRGTGRGTTSSYPVGTAEQVVALMRQLEVDRRLTKAALPLFLAGCWIRGDALRAAVTAELSALRTQLEKAAGVWRGRATVSPRPELMATRLAAGMMRRQVPRMTARERRLMLERLRQPLQWMPDDSPEGQLESTLTCLWYVVLTGRWLPGSSDIVYQAFVAFGGEALVSRLLPQVGVSFAPDLGALERQLRCVSLPYLTRTASKMQTEDFERARADFAPLVALFAFFAQALRSLFPEDAALFSPRRLVIDWPLMGPVVGLPLAFDLRRRAPEQLDAILTIAGEQLPAWQEAHEAGMREGVYRSEEDRARIREGMKAGVEAALEHPE